MSERLNEIRRATLADAASIGAVHVAAWRSAYPGLLPAQYLARLSAMRQAAFYERAIRLGAGVQVATQDNRVIGFSTARRSPNNPLGDGELETLYVLDDFREHGFGRRLLRASAAYLAQAGCGSLFAWMLRDNQAGFFYEHLGGKRAGVSVTRVGGRDIPQIAFAWNPIERLLGEP